ncbi:bifunctional 4-hydroxy-3-methylbut-2-enyl diphosphate reductase/30S ribosomal protein S1 [Schnuerera sp. xch1]|uniref:bifunctional 4-hydroxy-3-methylbut-2-enyl diphosphate reductase/30S ribosomal protein S1 n=1 Tax=Schnuerera sp. xch1 TaxID=2874283 RepID=UPI001CBCDAB9|nr:bifunctional 4-hydroxy-3-methylbut-2-enyl diphosphate reductase/30S ribosomal protein S1 [Schnuerera sp. xch1]MBZ2173794.1 bifunctional 4-hydroxy-3-methylbut-2-enyl diphosphate reductase/30S ribosomal protein S1 [Schnuerera sp. xch1]
MKIYLAKNAGYCFGVKRAVEIAEKTIEESKDVNVSSLGPLTHNPQVVNKFSEKGLRVIDKIDNLDGDKIIIRSHGIPYNIQKKIEDSNIELIDCTCPYVKSIHKKVEEYNKKGYQVIIVGDRNHPEVIGINGWCNNEAIVVNSEEDAINIINYDKICVVSQTTNTLEKFEKLSNIISNKGNEVKIFNTICNATNKRQTACKELASNVEAMIVIGGYNSSNTNKLVEISKKYCDNVYHIEVSKDLPLQDLLKFNKIGVTAGASTPDWIIKEVVNTMNNINDKNEEIMEAIENTLVKINRGDIVKGKVIYVTDNEIMVNINYKSDGIITKEEITDEPDVKPKDIFKEGDTLDVYVVRLDDGEGNVVLSLKRLEIIKGWNELENSYKNGEKVECKVLTNVKGGLTVIVNGIKGFMPASHISLDYIDDLSVYKNKKLIAKIIDLDSKRKRVILSSKVVEKENLQKKRKDLWDSLEVNKIIEGKVERLTDFGAFVDIGGLDGLVHISDLSWARINHPSDVVNIGDKITVQVLDFNKEKNRISLGLKQILPKPWDVFIKNRNVGDVVSGKVVNVLDFGAFVRLAEGVDGLIHISQISKEHVQKPSDKLKVGNTVTVKIIDINEEEQRISLSIKALEEQNDEKLTEKIENEDIDVKIEDIISEK